MKQRAVVIVAEHLSHRPMGRVVRVKRTADLVGSVDPFGRATSPSEEQAHDLSPSPLRSQLAQQDRPKAAPDDYLMSIEDVRDLGGSPRCLLTSPTGGRLVAEPHSLLLLDRSGKYRGSPSEPRYCSFSSRAANRSIRELDRSRPGTRSWVTSFHMTGLVGFQLYAQLSTRWACG
jgi:hypothetical protein